jgi:hypothetical protein
MIALFFRPFGLGLIPALVLVAPLASGAESRTRPAPESTPATGMLAAAPISPVTSFSMLLQVVKELENHVRAKDLGYVHNEDEILTAAMTDLMAQAETVTSGQSGTVKAALTALAQRVTALHIAADLGQQAQAELELDRVVESFAAVRRLFPEAVVVEAQKSVETFTCSNSGLPLASRQAVRASVRLTSPLAVGEPARAILRLEKTNGEPVLVTDLIETHTRKIHLLIVDPSLSDYHHEHPEQTRAPGEYSFGFTPRKSGGYRVWADLRTYPLGFQEYAVADIAGAGAGKPLTDRDTGTRVTVDELNYELLLPDPEVKAGRPVVGRLRVTARDGIGFAQLEPIMATFAHLVAFNEDYKSILHLHPKGDAVLDPAARGGPELDFVFFAMKPGFYRLFAQVQIDGRSRFAPFGIRVLP